MRLATARLDATGGIATVAIDDAIAVSTEEATTDDGTFPLGSLNAVTWEHSLPNPLGTSRPE